ncbi:MAG: 50S ribosomal protein L22, partial [Acidimicrobiales bacterium]
MPALKTNEREGTRAVLRHSRMSPYKARQVLDLIRGQEADLAVEILRFSEREAARVVGKLLMSALANAQHNDRLEREELYVSACYADEGTTLKRWRPRARGRATRIRKRTCHITLIVSRLPDDRLARRRARDASESTARRARRVAGTRRAAATAPAGEVTADEAAASSQDAGATEDVTGTEDAAGTEEFAGTEGAGGTEEFAGTEGAGGTEEFAGT